MTTDSQPARRTGPLHALLTALTTLLLVLSVGVVGVGIAWPGGEADSQADADELYASLDPSDPIRLEVPRLKIEAPIVPIDISPARALDPPRDAEKVGWWRESAPPGSRTGQTVVTGHSVHTGGGSMNRIGSLKEGDEIDVISKSGRMRYSVDKVRFFGRDDVAANAPTLFGQDVGDGRLVLVTCADWNGQFYERNVIVFGTPLGRPKELDVEGDSVEASS